MKEESKVASSMFKHTPVLADEVIDQIKKIPKVLWNKASMIDTTLGAGNHSSLVLQAFPNFKVIGLDQDPTAILASMDNLTRFKKRTKIIQTNFRNFKPSEKAAVVFADLGVSSPQLDIASRGFSFRLDGPIDMRMNQEEGIKASELIESLDENELANLLYLYGEERFSRRIAHRIKNDLSKKGEYSGTSALAYAIAGCYPPKLRHGRIHPATKTFQALRIAVNQEIKSLESLLENGPEWLLPGGIFLIISFHSIEDRLIKNSFKNDIRLKALTKKPIVASPIEVSNNHRCRSAKLRVAQII